MHHHSTPAPHSTHTWSDAHCPGCAGEADDTHTTTCGSCGRLCAIDEVIEIDADHVACPDCLNLAAAEAAFCCCDFGEHLEVASYGNWATTPGDTLFTRYVTLRDTRLPVDAPRVTVRYVLDVEDGQVLSGNIERGH